MAKPPVLKEAAGCNTNKHARLTFARRHEMVCRMTYEGWRSSGASFEPNYRVIGDRRDSVDGAGREMLFVAIDDHARIAFTAMHPDEKPPQAVQFLNDAVAYYGRLGVTIRRALTHNGSPFRSREFARACLPMSIKHRFTRAYRPQTNGKAERFIHSALPEWAHGWTYQNSANRSIALASWQHHYNWHQPHSGIGGAHRGRRARR